MVDPHLLKTHLDTNKSSFTKKKAKRKKQQAKEQSCVKTTVSALIILEFCHLERTGLFSRIFLTKFM